MLVHLITPRRMPYHDLCSHTIELLTEVYVDVLPVHLVLLQLLQELPVVRFHCVPIGCCHGNIKLSVHHLQLPVPLFLSLLLVPVTLFNEHLSEGGGIEDEEKKGREREGEGEKEGRRRIFWSS